MADSVDLHFERSGDGPAIVILHGLFGSARNWQSVARRLSDNYSVIAVDLRNHGSSPHNRIMDYAVLAADVAALLDDLSLEAVTLLGHSMGGKAAMTLALRNCAPIARLVIVDIAPGGYINEYNATLDAMQRLDLSATTRRSDAHAQLAESIPDLEIRSFILQNLRFRADGPPLWRINLQAIRNNIESLVGPVPRVDSARFDGPVHFIRGELSARITDSDLVSMKQLFPAFDLLTIPNAGHWPHAENPREFLARLRPLLEGKLEKSGS